MALHRNLKKTKASAVNEKIEKKRIEVKTEGIKARLRY